MVLNCLVTPPGRFAAPMRVTSSVISVPLSHLLEKDVIAVELVSRAELGKY